jgi:excisionase family DNA binding protein
MATGTEPLIPIPHLLNCSQVADILGISVRKVRRMKSQREIPHVKVGRSVRFRPQDIESYVMSNVVVAV